MSWSPDRIRAAQARLLEAEGPRFDALVRLVGLDPATDFRGANLTGVDFSGCDLRDLDFSGARLWGCVFEGARIEGARFDKAELGSALSERPAADLRKAADWSAYAAGWRRSARPVSDLYLPAHVFYQDAPFAPAMAVIPAGRFLMGSPPDEPGRDDDEGPQHEVRFAQPFALGRYAVTFNEYDAYCEATGAKKPGDKGWGRGRRPVIYVSWEDAQGYCRWLSEQTGEAYRLPSAAEWEYACRAGTATPFWWGREITPEQANYNGTFVYEGGGAKGVRRWKTEPVDAFAPNPWGLHQTYGNVWEWCEDAWNESYRGAPDDGSAWTAGDTTSAVLRGGSWSNRPEDMRSANRLRNGRVVRDSNVGFRVARTHAN